MVHCCSLVHDDLPAMDDDTLRRGRPTAHVKFGQAMAILVGDALLTRAFGLLAKADDRRSGRLTCELARAAGAAGMVAGQVADMDLCQLPEGLEGIRFIHLRKTAAMLRAAARMGAICADADDKTVDALGDYAEAIGLAFQLFDDLLDVTGAAETIGKTPGKDAGADKRTAAAQLSLDGARKLGNELTDRAIASLESLGEKADTLICLTRLLALRTH
jgi:farnesyl diphosphate synthase